MLTLLQYLVSYYERFGFKRQGESKAEFGGGGWHDMVNTDLILIFAYLNPSKLTIVHQIFDFAGSDKPPN